MNLLVLAVLGALAWYAFENGMEFFAILVVIAGVLLLFTEKPGVRYSKSEERSVAGQPIIIEEDGAYPGTKEINLKVKDWKDRWNSHPNEYLFLHVGYALNNLARSILYIFGIEKDEKK